MRALLAATASLLLAAPAAVASVPLPSTSPITGSGAPFTGALAQADLGANGYEEKEYRVTLSSPQVYTLTAPGGSTATASGAPPSLFGAYRSRIIVRGPQNPADFNGTVVVEVMNATTGVDLDILWQQSYEYFQRTGAIYVAVAAQPLTLLSATTGPPSGVSRLAARYAGQGLNLATPTALANFTNPNPAIAGAAQRDASLAWDLIGQVGQLAKSEAGPFAGLDVERVLATGWSQSASYLTTYVNVIHPLQQVYDGFLLGARGTGATLLGFSTPTNPLTVVTQTTLQGGGTPVINLQTETDSKSPIVRRADADSATDRFRLYEVPGSAHNDEWSSIQAVDIISRDTFIGSGPPFPGLPSGCGWTGEQKITSFPVRYVANAAFDGLAGWANGGSAAPSAALISAPNSATAGGIARDASGNALGGIRSPWLEAPNRSYFPLSPPPVPPAASFCSLTGLETPFSDGTAGSRYTDYSAFLSEFEGDLDAAIASGFVLPGDKAAALAFGSNAYNVRPDAPAVISGDAGGTGSFELGWNGPDPADAEPFTAVRYELEVRRDGGAWESVDASLTSRSFDVAGPLADGTYEYRVRTIAVQTPPQHTNVPITVESDWSAAGTVVVDKFDFAVGQPINADGSSIFKLNRTIPVKITLTDANGDPVVGEELRLSLAKLTDEIEGDVLEDGFTTGSANTGNVFRDQGNGEYIYNLSTKNLSTGTWNIRATTEDGSIFRVRISLR
jgi:hypothetical protein